MKGRKKKERVVSEVPNEEIFGIAVAELTHAVVEELEEENISAEEPFEQYTHQLRGKIHTDFDAFQSRFIKGYQALVEEIAHEKNEQSKPPKNKS